MYYVFIGRNNCRGRVLCISKKAQPRKMLLQVMVCVYALSAHKEGGAEVAAAKAGLTVNDHGTQKTRRFMVACINNNGCVKLHLTRF